MALKSCGGTKGSTYKTFIDTNVDFLFIVFENKEMYLINRKYIKNKSTLNICDKYQIFQVFI